MVVTCNRDLLSLRFVKRNSWCYKFIFCRSGHHSKIFTSPVSRKKEQRVMDDTLEAWVRTLEASLLVNRDMDRGDPPRKPGGNHREIPVGFAAPDPIKSTRINGDGDEGEIVDETNLRPYDILCGRGRSSWNNIGNRRFRVTVHLNLQRYIQAKTKQDKTVLITEVADMLRSEVGARFLKRARDGTLRVMGEKESRDKVGHALRDLNSIMMNNDNKNGKSSKASTKKSKGGKQDTESSANDDSSFPPLPDMSFSWPSDD